MADTGSNMSTLTALAPALETQRSRASAIRMAIVTLVYLAIVLAGAIYPLVSPLSDFWNAPVRPLGQAVAVLTGVDRGWRSCWSAWPVNQAAGSGS